MTINLVELPPELREAVARAREDARLNGSLRPPRVGRFKSELTDEERAAVAGMLGEGAYADAVAEIAASDPDLADQ